MEELKKYYEGKPIPLIEKVNNLPDEIYSEAIEIINSGVESFTRMVTLENGKTKTYCELDNLSKYIKENMDKKFGPTWQCIIGEGMSFDINYQQNSLFYCVASGYLAILLYKS